MESKISPHCVKCLLPCTGEVLKYNDRIFHSSCLTCGVCGISLNSRGFFFVDDRYYCTDDYHDLFGTRCSSCNQFVEGEVVTALGNTYHQDCFVCSRCKSAFPPGEKVSFTGKEYLCQKCSTTPERRTIPVHKCAGCTQEIKSGQALLALDKHWHLWCFTCTKCRCLLSGEYMGRKNLVENFNPCILFQSNKPVFFCLHWRNCYEYPETYRGVSQISKDGKPYCERDYQLEFGVTCAGCGGYITGKVLQAGEKHYHPRCSRCAKCNREFGEGEEMYLQGSEIWHPDCSHAVAAGLENGDPVQDAATQLKEKPALMGRKYDEAAERPLLASQQRETNSAPDELKFSRPTKQFDLNERSVGQMNGDLDEQPPRPPPPERTAASRVSDWKSKFPDGPSASSTNGVRDTSSRFDAKSKGEDYQRARPYSFHESSSRAPTYESAPDINNKKEKTIQSKISVPMQRPVPPALQVRRHSSDNTEAPLSGEKYAHHRRSMPSVLRPDEVSANKPAVKFYPYEDLKTSNYKLPRGVDHSKLERYLSDEEFKKVFSITREEFYTLPKWKQDSQKKKLLLF